MTDCCRTNSPQREQLEVTGFSLSRTILWVRNSGRTQLAGSFAPSSTDWGFLKGFGWQLVWSGGSRMAYPHVLLPGSIKSLPSPGGLGTSSHGLSSRLIRLLTRWFRVHKRASVPRGRKWKLPVFERAVSLPPHFCWQSSHRAHPASREGTKALCPSRRDVKHL